MFLNYLLRYLLLDLQIKLSFLKCKYFYFSKRSHENRVRFYPIPSPFPLIASSKQVRNVFLGWKLF